jgi:hypothetical protein
MFGEEIVGKVVEIAGRFIPDTAQRDKFQAEFSAALLSADTQLALSQSEVNKIEAANEHIFISGWRPFIGWICGCALGYHFILQPLLAFIFASFNHPIALPVFNMDALNTILMGMLGLGGMRSFEKVKGVK